MAKGRRGALIVLLLVVVGIVKGCVSSPKETFTSPGRERNWTVQIQQTLLAETALSRKYELRLVDS